MIFNIGWLALILTWLSGLAAGRVLEMIVPSSGPWQAYALVSALVLAGTFLRATIRR